MSIRTSFEDALSVVGIDPNDPDLTDEERDILRSVIGLEIGRRKERRYKAELVTKSEGESSEPEPFDLWRLDERLEPSWGQIKSLARKSCGLDPDELSEIEVKAMLERCGHRLTVREASRLNPVVRR